MNTDSVAEYVINAALTLLKNIPLMHQETLIEIGLEPQLVQENLGARQLVCLVLV